MNLLIVKILFCNNIIKKMACTELLGVITGAFEFIGYSEHID